MFQLQEDHTPQPPCLKFYSCNPALVKQWRMNERLLAAHYRNTHCRFAIGFSMVVPDPSFSFYCERPTWSMGKQSPPPLFLARLYIVLFIVFLHWLHWGDCNLKELGYILIFHDYLFSAVSAWSLPLKK